MLKEKHPNKEQDYKIDGTTGTPLGGFGAGAVKFNAMKGSFAVITKAPADQHDYYHYKNSRFQFYSNVDDNIKSIDTLTALCVNGRYDDDAIWPIHNVNFGNINGIQVDMTAFSPLDTKDHELMCLPYTFYEITVENQNSINADVAFAFLWDITSEDITNYNNNGISSDKWAVYATSDDFNALLTAGFDKDFLFSGECNNRKIGTFNRNSVNMDAYNNAPVKMDALNNVPINTDASYKVAIKLNLAPHEKRTIKFVLAWYDNTDPDGAFYLSQYNNVAEIASLGLNNFDRLKKNATTLVQNMRNSNLPIWFINQTLNSLANISNNSIYKTDGRIAFAEGEWTCFGTMDQMWHARKIISELCPFFAWKELEYWARTQRKDGQIHHDFTPFEISEENPKYKLCGWDDTEHPDYRKIDNWVDLNCGLIISVYETYQQTADEEKLLFFWPYVKKAAKRILDQVELYGDKQYPYTFSSSDNSYDAGGDPNPFNTSLSIVTYKIMIKLCEKMDDNTLLDIYQLAFTTAVSSYRLRYLKNNFAAGRISESYFSGQWLALSLKLGQIFTEEETDYVISRLDSHYHPLYKGLGYTNGTYDEWTPYILAHYGGLLLNTRRQKQYEYLQKDAYNRQYLNRNYVFNQPLDILPAITKTIYTSTTISGDKQYISTPVIWRNYYNIVGFHRDKSTSEIWIQPIILEEMNHVMIDACFITPEGYGTISCTESGQYHQNKDIVLKTEFQMEVNSLHLTDNFGDGEITVVINDIPCKYSRIGEGYSKELFVEWHGIIDHNGIHIVTIGNPGNAPHEDPIFTEDILDMPQSIPDRNAYEIIQATDFSEQAGVIIAKDDNGMSFVTECNNFDYIKFNNIGFETTGAEYIKVKVSSNLQGSSIQIVLDSVGGEAIGTIQIPCENKDEGWTEVISAIEKTTGTHNVIFRFFGSSEENLLNLASFTFLKTNHFEIIERKNWTATSSFNNSISHLALDGLINTRWHTRAQMGGEWFLLDMKGIISFNKIILDSGVKINDYPRGYEIYVSKDGKDFGNVIASGVGTEGTTIIDLSLQNARFIKIVQTGKTESTYWSIFDLCVFNTTLRPKM